MLKFIALFFLISLSTNAQDFAFQGRSYKSSIPVKIIGNLIFIPIVVNDVPLTFLLDSGVNQTILFSLDESQELELNNVEKVQMRGLGVAVSVDGLRSTQNKVSIGKVADNSHEIFIILDSEINFSSHVGIPVNGIIGYELFKNLVVEIDYDKQKLHLFKDISKVRGLAGKQVTKIAISIELHKPYVMANIFRNGNHASKLLVDTGNSDALWIFNSSNIQIPTPNFDDYLGRGFSGNIYGKRARVQKFTFADYHFEQPIVAFPDSASTRGLKMVDNRAGSVGGEILKRFKVVFDYRNQSLYLQKGKNFESDFRFNMSGMEVHHNGVQWIKETVAMNTKINTTAYDLVGDVIRNDFKYKFELKPVYLISTVRENSPASIAGLQEKDIIVKINGVWAHRYSLSEINEILKSVVGKRIQIEVDRQGKNIKIEFYLKKAL